MFTQTFFIYTFYKELQQPAKVKVRSRDAKQRLPATVLFCKILCFISHRGYIHMETLQNQIPPSSS